MGVCFFLFWRENITSHDVCIVIITYFKNFKHPVYEFIFPQKTEFTKNTCFKKYHISGKKYILFFWLHSGDKIALYVCSCPFS